MLRYLPLGLLWLALGCAAPDAASAKAPGPSPTFGPPAPQATPTPAPTPDPLNATPAFGAIEMIWKVDNELERIYREGEDPAKKYPGSAQGHYLRVNGQTYAIHFQYWEAFDRLHVGDTVNLHPTDYIVAPIDAQGHEAPRRMWKVFPGDRFVPPLVS